MYLVLAMNRPDCNTSTEKSFKNVFELDEAYLLNLHLTLSTTQNLINHNLVTNTNTCAKYLTSLQPNKPSQPTGDHIFRI